MLVQVFTSLLTRNYRFYNGSLLLNLFLFLPLKCEMSMALGTDTTYTSAQHCAAKPQAPRSASASTQRPEVLHSSPLPDVTFVASDSNYVSRHRKPLTHLLRS